MEAYVEIVSPQGTRKVPLNAAPITIGRGAGNTVVLPDDMVSRRHCVIEGEPTAIRLRDLNLRNGTLLNGQLVKEADLKHGDVVMVGSTRIEVYALAGNIERLTESDIVEEVTTGTRPIAQPDPDGLNWNERVQGSVHASASQAGKDQIAFFNARGQAALSNTEGAEEGLDAVHLLRRLLLLCFEHRASDMHVEPRREGYQVRFRVNGAMVDVLSMPKPLGTKMTAVVKVLCDIDIAQRNIIQEGGFGTDVADTKGARRGASPIVPVSPPRCWGKSW